MKYRPRNIKLVFILTDYEIIDKLEITRTDSQIWKSTDREKYNEGKNTADIFHQRFIHNNAFCTNLSAMPALTA